MPWTFLPNQRGRSWRNAFWASSSVLLRSSLNAHDKVPPSWIWPQLRTGAMPGLLPALAGVGKSRGDCTTCCPVLPFFEPHGPRL